MNVRSSTSVLASMMILLTIGFALSLLGSVPLAYALSYEFSQSITDADGAGGAFDTSYDVAVNSTHIFVVDTGNDRVQIFDSSGNFADTFGDSGSGNGQFNTPRGIAVNSTHIFVSDNDNNDVQIFDSSGNFADTFGTTGAGNGQFSNPRGIAVNSTHIFVVDTGNERVQIFDLSGNFADTFGTLGSGNGQFSNPFGVAVDSNDRIIVSDINNDDVQIFDSSGNFVLTFGTTGSGNGQFDLPFGVAVDSNNRIIVADNNNDRVQIFDSSGNFVLTFGTTGTDDGQFNSPLGVAVDSNNRILVTDFTNNNVQIFILPTLSTVSTNGGGSCGVDCIGPTLGVNSDGKRLVDDGFSYNGKSVDVEYYYTPYPLVTVNVGEQNVAEFKIYENLGPDNIRHFELAFGLASGESIGMSKAVINWDKSFDGIETITLDDPENVLETIIVNTFEGPCSDESQIKCLIVKVGHTFRSPLDFNILGTNVWDVKRNAWQNYYNHGIEVVGDSLNPSKTYDGINKGQIYHLTETGKGIAIDEFGNSWSFHHGIWNKDYVKPSEPNHDYVTSNGNCDRNCNWFEMHKIRQAILAKETMSQICSSCNDEAFEFSERIIS